MIRINGEMKESQAAIPFENSTRNMWHLTNNDEGRALYEPARSTDFELFVYGLDDLVENTNAEEAQEVIRIAVASAPVPNYSIAALQQRRGNTVQKFAGTPEFQEGQLELYDWIGVNTKSILLAWQKKASNLETGKTGILTDYKKNAVLCEYSPDGQIVRAWDIYGCWVNAISEQPFSHAEPQSERRITATLQYDMAVPRTTDL
jgi:hypothetical protein